VDHPAHERGGTHHRERHADRHVDVQTCHVDEHRHGQDRAAATQQPERYADERAEDERDQQREGQRESA